MHVMSPTDSEQILVFVGTTEELGVRYIKHNAMGFVYSCNTCINVGRKQRNTTHQSANDTPHVVVGNTSLELQ